MEKTENDYYWLNTFRKNEVVSESGTTYSIGYTDYLISSPAILEALKTILSAISIETQEVTITKKEYNNGVLVKEVNNQVEREELNRGHISSSKIKDSLDIITKCLLPHEDSKNSIEKFELPDMTEALKAISDVKRHVVLNVDEVPENMTVDQVIAKYNEEKVLRVSGKRTNNKISSKIY